MLAAAVADDLGGTAGPAPGRRWADPLGAPHADPGRPPPDPGRGLPVPACHRRSGSRPWPAWVPARAGRWPTWSPRRPARPRFEPRSSAEAEAAERLDRFEAAVAAIPDRQHGDGTVSADRALRRGHDRCRRGGHAPSPASSPATALEVVVLERADDVGAAPPRPTRPSCTPASTAEPGSLESSLVAPGPRPPGRLRRTVGHRRSSGPGRLSSPGTRTSPTASTVSWRRPRPTATSRPDRLDVEELLPARAPPRPGAHRRARGPRRVRSSAPGARARLRHSRRWAPASSCVSGPRSPGSSERAAGWQLAPPGGRGPGRWLVNAAGLDADLLDRRFGHDGFTVTPRRGQLLVFDKLARPLLSLDHPAGAHRRDQGRAGRAHRLRQRPARAHGRGPRRPDATPPPPRAARPPGSPAAAILPGLLDEEVTATYAGLRAATEHRDYQLQLDAERALRLRRAGSARPV